jgi:regulator of protease activity HflC (stomatin/prohibitin superfamily)
LALTKIIVNCETGVTEEIELTAEEMAEVEAAQAQAEADRIVREAEATALAELKASAKAKLIAGEPLTEEEASTLIV